MAIKPIADAYNLGWRVNVRCACRPRDAMKRVRDYEAEPDLQTVAWTRFPAGEAGEPPQMSASRVTARAVSVQRAAHEERIIGE